ELNCISWDKIYVFFAYPPKKIVFLLKRLASLQERRYYIKHIQEINNNYSIEERGSLIMKVNKKWLADRG
ncbi:hypothetical protein ACQ5RT_06955, partial [Limosilactobacillus fermentum]